MSSKFLKIQIQNGKVQATPHVLILILPPPPSPLAQRSSTFRGSDGEFSLESVEGGFQVLIPEWNPYIIQAQLIPDS